MLPANNEMIITQDQADDLLLELSILRIESDKNKDRIDEIEKILKEVGYEV